MDLLDLLRQVPLFQSMSPQGLSGVAALFEEMTVSAGTYLSRQGDLGATFYLVERGQAIVQRMDENGYERPVGTIDDRLPYYGITSLFVVIPRDATVVARTEMHLWVLHRPAFLTLLAEQPQIERELSIPADIQMRRRAPRYPWQAKGEQLAFVARKHWIVFVQKMFWWTVVAILLAVSMLYIAENSSNPLLATYLLLPLLAIYAVSVIWNLIDWRNDYYAVTNRRISYREHVAFLYDSRDDAPLDQIQNVSVSRNLLAQLLRYGEVTVQTAADNGTMRFRYVADPEGLRKAIFDEQERAQATRHAEQRWKIREMLARRVTVEEATSADVVSALEEPLDLIDGNAPPPKEPGRWHRLADRIGRLEIIPPIHQHTPDRVVWRKHWLFLVTGVFLPLVAFLLLASLAIVALTSDDTAISGLVPGLILVGLAAGSFLWLTYRYTDWGNDLYIVTDERIIDDKQRPLWLSAERREASLGKIQNVHYVVPNVIASLLRYGDVVVQTAGEGDFTFVHVPNPGDVQNEIFRRIHNYRLHQQRKQTDSQREELATWFAEYDDLKGNKPQTASPQDHWTQPPTPPPDFSFRNRD